jgi:hypothetical protein
MLKRWIADQEIAIKKAVAIAEHNIKEEQMKKDKDLEDKRLSFDAEREGISIVPPEVVAKYRTEKALADHGKEYEEKLVQRQTEALSALGEQIQQLGAQVQQVAEKAMATVTKAEAVRTADGKMRAVRVTKSDGSVQEIAASLH